MIALEFVISVSSASGFTLIEYGGGWKVLFAGCECHQDTLMTMRTKSEPPTAQ